jgi:alcohol dehydrogenase class IV
MRLVKEYLPRAYADGNDLEARTQMMAAALMGAVAFQKGLGAIHAISHPIGALYNTHHGTTNATVMAPVLLFNRSAIEDKIAAAARYLGIEGGFDGFLRFVNEINASLGIPTTLRALCGTEPDVDAILAGALKDPSTGGNPIEMNAENTKSLIEACL